MDRLYKLFPSESGRIGLWDCQRCGRSHDASQSWVLVGVGPDERGADVLCPECASELEDEDAPEER